MRQHLPHKYQDGGSFRDPAGFVFSLDGKIYRQVNKAGQKDYDFFIQSGLYKELVDRKLLVSHKVITKTKNIPTSPDRYKIIQPEAIPFLSYPYEWSFSQLKDAALLTLEIQRLALNHGMILKDASAYNVQFIGHRPIFIDSLSFRIYQAGSPWDGYKQYCEHFIAPLALAVNSSADILKTLSIFIDGLPLALAKDLLPVKARLKKGLLGHIYIHSRSQKHYHKIDLAKPAKEPKVSKLAMEGLMTSLRKTVVALDPPDQQTEWGDYYNDTNYTSRAFGAKKKIIAGYLDKIKPKLVWDLGANDGTFSEISAKKGAYTVASDIDPLAVELNYKKKRPNELNGLILPIFQDLSNPSPALGWAHQERKSFEERGPSDVVMALALVHHLAIGNNLPLNKIASFFASLGKYLIIEFIPKGDSKVDLLLHRRANIFPDYTQEHFEQVFKTFFNLIDVKPVPGSKRVIYLFKVKNANGKARQKNA